MTLIIHIGRRVPRSWFRRQASKAKGLLTFQENIWIMIKQSMNLAKRKANESKKIKFVMSFDREIEDINYEIEWIKIIIQGNKEQEKEEYDDTMKLYSPFGKIFKKDFANMESDERLKKHFKSKVLSSQNVEDAYKKGYGVVEDDNMSNKLLEMGILTHVELIDDYATRNDMF